MTTATPPTRREPRAFDRLDPDRMYRALLERDADFEGLFVVAVRTTGIFCRPTCPARKPLRENVAFLPSAREAIAAGFRACRRCRPLESAPGAVPEIVARLMERVRANPARRISDADLRREGLDPATVRRRFKAAIGMTFQAWHRAERLGGAFARLREPEGTALDAAGAAGYASLSGFSGAFAALFGATPGRIDDAAALRARWLETPLGPMVAIAHEEGLVLLEFCDRRALEREVRDLRRRFRSIVVAAPHPHLDAIERDLAAWFRDPRHPFTVPLHLVGTPFEVATWRGLRRIPVGETRSYGAQAAALGRPGAARATGRANGANRIAIVVPCHRVIGADGALVGYGGGLWRKRWLLRHEATAIAP